MADTMIENNYASDLTRQRQAAKMDRPYSSSEIAKHANLYESDVSLDQAKLEAGRRSRLERIRNKARNKLTKSTPKSGGLGGVDVGTAAAGAAQAAKQLKSGNIMDALKTVRTTGTALGANYIKWVAWGAVLSPLFWVALPYLTLHMIFSMMGSKTFVMSWLERGTVMVIDIIFAGLVFILIFFIYYLVELAAGGASSIIGG